MSPPLPTAGQLEYQDWEFGLFRSMGAKEN